MAREEKKLDNGREVFLALTNERTTDKYLARSVCEISLPGSSLALPFYYDFAFMPLYGLARFNVNENIKLWRYIDWNAGNLPRLITSQSSCLQHSMALDC